MPGGRPQGHPKTGGRKAGSKNGFKVREADKHIEAVKVSVARVLEEYAHIAFVDIAGAFDIQGRLLPIHQIPEPIRRALGGIEAVSYEEDGDGKGSIGKLHKIKIIEKTRALDSIAKHLGMFVDKVEHSGVVSISEIEVRLVKAINGRRAEETHN